MCPTGTETINLGEEVGLSLTSSVSGIHGYLSPGLQFNLEATRASCAKVVCPFIGMIKYIQTCLNVRFTQPLYPCTVFICSVISSSDKLTTSIIIMGLSLFKNYVSFCLIVPCFLALSTSPEPPNNKSLTDVLSTGNRGFPLYQT